MRLKQILNNNAIISVDENGDDVLLFGNGLGFKSQLGAKINLNKVDKQLILKDKKHINRFREILDSVPNAYILLAEDVISNFLSKNQVKLNEIIHISLVDHIYNAILTFREGIVVPNSLLYDLMRFYPNEYAAGKYALDLIEREFQNKLPEDEAGFIAMHFVTAQQRQKNASAKKLVTLVRKIDRMIMEELDIQIDQSSLAYFRYMTHLKYFAQRVMDHFHYPPEDSKILQAVLKEHPKEYACSKHVCEYIRENFGYNAGNDEEIYLAVHLARLN